MSPYPVFSAYAAEVVHFAVRAISVAPHWFVCFLPDASERSARALPVANRFIPALPLVAPGFFSVVGHWLAVRIAKADAPIGQAAALGLQAPRPLRLIFQVVAVLDFLQLHFVAVIPGLGFMAPVSIHAARCRGRAIGEKPQHGPNNPCPHITPLFCCLSPSPHLVIPHPACTCSVRGAFGDH